MPGDSSGAESEGVRVVERVGHLRGEYAPHLTNEPSSAHLGRVIQQGQNLYNTVDLILPAVTNFPRHLSRCRLPVWHLARE